MTTRTSRPSPEREIGFTLIELLVVLAIIALVAGIAVSRRPTAGGALEKGRMIAGLGLAVDAAQARASASGRPTEIRLAELDMLPAGTAIAPAIGVRRDIITVFPDGSSTGGRVAAGGRQVATINWLTGAVSDAR